MSLKEIIYLQNMKLNATLLIMSKYLEILEVFLLSLQCFFFQQSISEHMSEISFQ